MAADMRELPEDTELLLQPLGLSVDAGEPSRLLAGGPLRFARLRAIYHLDGERLEEATVDIAGLESWQRTLPEEFATRFARRFEALTRARQPLSLPGGGLPLGFSRPLVMGVVNVTPDSFSDGGRFAEIDAAVAHAVTLVEAGADIIDVGGESTRPGARPVWEEEERQRVLPVIEAIRGRARAISIDTRKSGVMTAALEAGADILNDVSALTYDENSQRVAAESSATVILMHARGDPATMQRNPQYEDVLCQVFAWLERRIAACESAGIEAHRLLVDPGIGFGKTLRHNLELIDGLAAFQGLGVPVLLGASRKRFIGALSGEEAADRRMPGSIAAALAGAAHGAQVLRVHDVAETRQALGIFQGLADTAALRIPEGLDNGAGGFAERY